MMTETNCNKVLDELKRKKYNFGQSLRFIREMQGLTIRRVAKEVNKTPTYISDIERGNNKPPEKKLLIKLMEALSLHESEIEIQNYLFDLAAGERGGVSEDIVDYIMKNSELRMAIRMAQQQDKGGKLWLDCVKSLQ